VKTPPVVPLTQSTTNDQKRREDRREGIKDMNFEPKYCSIFGYSIANNFNLREEVSMQPLIKPSSELRKNYNSIVEICAPIRPPIFLTRNGAGDTVIMDIETYSRREEDLATAERLLAAERARMAGAQGYTIDEFKSNMLEAVKKGAKSDEP
jgi:PHD/YefM family antitoxin component YafN of YafNO toxin-antitoxin module